jgi:hypothetical protein
MRTGAYVVGCVILVAARTGAAQTFRPEIPRTWADDEVARFELPLAQRDRTPRFLTAREYYAQKVRTIYRTYPVFVNGREPAGYFDSLKQKDPEVIFDSAKLRTKEDWIRAGEVVFRAAPRMAPVSSSIEFPLGVTIPATSDGIIPNLYYVIRKRGTVELATESCSDCHTRVLAGNIVLNGAQGNVPVGQLDAADTKQAAGSPARVQRMRDLEWLRAGAPWVMPRVAFDEWFRIDDFIRARETMQAGVYERQGTDFRHPVHIPSLIGIEDIKYLDATGLVRHRSIGDLMRYAAVNYALDMIGHYGDFQPSPSQALFAEDGVRFSDEQLYALGLYLYSLKPPPNPNPMDDRARRGERIFQQQGCAGCHTPPLYTNNKLTPAPGFNVPDDLRKTDDIMNVSVGTDAWLATRTRRGTGFYKVPSLRGVWFRNAFGHSGQAETLEEWFDPGRLKDDYVPKGFHVGSGAIKGHEFGLKLGADDRQDLIAFLRTL